MGSRAGVTIGLGALHGLVFIISLTASGLVACAGDYRTGGLHFSDRLGGMELVTASGTGTRSDPIVIVERLISLEPVVLEARRLVGIGGKSGITGTSLGRILRIFVHKVVINATGRVWGGFDLELQEQLGEPSVFGDGLSFDQIRSFGDVVVHSDAFARGTWSSEPYDRLRFRIGSVDPGGAVRFSFAITDVSPSAGFYLHQQPLYLSAEGPRSRKPGNVRRVGLRR